MELRHLRYFATVAELLNFTRAAEELRVAQPALSRQIRSLEDELGVRLLDRNSRGVCLTREGQRFLPEARAVLARAEQALATIRGTPQTELVRIGYAPTLASQILPAATARWQAQHPHARVELHDLSTTEMIAGLRAGRLDLVIGAHPLHAAEGLECRTLREEQWRLALPPRHPLARPGAVAVTALRGVPIISFPAADYPEYVERVAGYLRAHGLRFQAAQECDGVLSLVSAVESGAGVALVSESFACLFPRRVPVRPLRPAPEPFPVAVSWRPRQASPAVRAFVETLLPTKAAARVRGAKPGKPGKE